MGQPIPRPVDPPGKTLSGGSVGSAVAFCFPYLAFFSLLVVFNFWYGPHYQQVKPSTYTLGLNVVQLGPLIVSSFIIGFRLKSIASVSRQRARRYILVSAICFGGYEAILTAAKITFTTLNMPHFSGIFIFLAALLTFILASGASIIANLITGFSIFRSIPAGDPRPPHQGEPHGFRR